MPQEEQVIELSVEETNGLRKQLGLPPLRDTRNQEKDQQQEMLEISVDETNQLREQLGLAPLRSTQQRNIVHAPAQNEAAQQAAERVETARLKRQVELGMTKFGETSLADQETDVKKWAKQMRTNRREESNDEEKKEKSEQRYEETDLQGLSVGHALAELEEGSTTVLTLTDTGLLKTQDDTSKKVVGLNEDDVQLQNVDLAERRKQQEGLKDKRQLELGMGRAGGYAGFDDDEFEELGGSQAPSNLVRGARGPSSSKVRGFTIGAMLQEQEEQTDLFAAQSGKPISLEAAHADITADDFMTVEEEEELRRGKKEAKFKKKKKKDRKKHRSKEQDDDEEEAYNFKQSNMNGKTLLEELEGTAEDTTLKSTTRKRRRETDDDAEQIDENNDVDKDLGHEESSSNAKRAKYDAIMAKGNQRTQEAFQAKSKTTVNDLDDEPDDAFLNAALAKARRLNRLKEMSGAKRGAEAVLAAVQSSEQPKSVTTGDTITFAVDETREFTRALRAKAEQTERKQTKSAITDEGNNDLAVVESNVKPDVVTVKEEIETETEEMDIQELAREVKEDSSALDGTTGSSTNIGRGIGSFLGMLQHTGDLTRKNAGKEELRGRAKDERHYEDYQPVKLSDVVKIDETNASEKDKEFAKREVKLEYRDKFGRLLTRKEAFRDLSYQFHGYGAGKRKQEKKMQQIALEQAEARFASQNVSDGGTLGALKRTQQATGKAYIVHKT